MRAFIEGKICLVWSCAFLMLCAHTSTGYALTDTIDIDVIVQSGGELHLDVQSRHGSSIGSLTAQLPPGSPRLNRVSFGELKVDYFVADAFSLTCYTNDGTGGHETLGIPGVSDPSVRMLLKVWTPGFGPGQLNALMIPPDAGDATPGFKVPNPKHNGFWNDPVTAVWALLTEKDSAARVVLSSSAPSSTNPAQTQIQAPGFSVYFATDLLGLKAQEYRGPVVFELLVN